MIELLRARARAACLAFLSAALTLVAAPAATAAPCDISNVSVTMANTENFVWSYDPLQQGARIRYLDLGYRIEGGGDCAVAVRAINPADPNSTIWPPGYTKGGLLISVWLAGTWGDNTAPTNLAGGFFAGASRTNRYWGNRWPITVNAPQSQGIPLAGQYSIPLRVAIYSVPLDSPCALPVLPPQNVPYVPRPECPEQTFDVPLVIKFPAAVNPGSFGGVVSDGQLQPTQFPDLNLLTKTAVTSTFQANVPYRLTFASANGGILLRDNDPNSRIVYDGKARLTNNGWGTWDVFVIGSQKTRNYLDADPKIGFTKTLILELKIVDKSQGWLAGTYTDTVTITVEQAPGTPVPP